MRRGEKGVGERGGERRGRKGKGELTRDGHAYAAIAVSCRMMRICAYAYACRQKKSDSAKREKLTFLKRQ